MQVIRHNAIGKHQNFLSCARTIINFIGNILRHLRLSEVCLLSIGTESYKVGCIASGIILVCQMYLLPFGQHHLSFRTVRGTVPTISTIM